MACSCERNSSWLFFLRKVQSTKSETRPNYVARPIHGSRRNVECQVKIRSIERRIEKQVYIGANGGTKELYELKHLCLERRHCHCYHLINNIAVSPNHSMTKGLNGLLCWPMWLSIYKIVLSCFQLMLALCEAVI